MIPPDNYIIFLKFSEQRWIDSLVNGNFSFSCVGKFIQQAQATGDTVQGDSFEGYFARLKKDDKRLTIMRSRLKDDLEESNDGNYVLLRRKSALTVPIFCIYGYQCIDAVNEAPSSGKTRIRHNFDARLFDAFANKWNSSIVADDRRATYVILQARAIANRIAEMRDKELKNMLKKQRRERKALANRVLTDRIQYDIDERGEFFINPIDNYPELLHKRCEYAYQYETRIYFPDIHLSHIFDRKSVAVSAFDKSEYRIDHMPMRMNITADVVRWKKKDE